jgi:hypothetical protein
MGERGYSDEILRGGWSGGIPQHMIDKKYERTNIYEDKDLLQNYQRETLLDNRPDPITLASDEFRNNGEFNADELAMAKKLGIDVSTLPSGKTGNAYNRSVLNIRENGQRATNTPNHSEIFLELTGADPRGTSNLPQMQQMAEHARRRAGNYELSFKNDSDNSIMESAINPSQISTNIKKAMMASKQKLQIFSESDIGWSARSNTTFSTKSQKEKVMLDGKAADIRDEDIQHRRSNITLLSNTAPGGWLQQADHKIKMGKFASVYSGNSKMVDIRSNMNESDADLKIVKFQDSYVPGSVVSLMDWHTKARQNYLETLPPSSRYWGKSSEHDNMRAYMANKGDSSNVLLAKDSETAKKLKIVKDEILGIARKLKREQFKGHTTKNTEVSEKMTRVMKNAVETNNSGAVKDAKDIVKIKSDVINSHRATTNEKVNNKTHVRTMNNKVFKGHAQGESLVSGKTGKKEHVVHNYSNSNNKNKYNGMKKDNSTNDHEMHELHDDLSHVRSVNSSDTKNLVLTKNDTDTDGIEFRDSNYLNRYGGVIGTKYINHSKIEQESHDILEL